MQRAFRFGLGLFGLAWLGCSPAISPAPPDLDATAGPTAQGTTDAPPPVPARKPALASYGDEHIGVVLPDDSICDKNEDGSLKVPIPEGTYKGLLRNARCEQQKFITMARVADALGVKCSHCHAPNPADPKSELYDKPTREKSSANWMLKTFVSNLRPVNGKKLMCADCHKNRETQKQVPKVLRSPRDGAFAQEWMHEVMTTEFVEKTGKRLKCKSCHTGMAPGTDGWENKVIFNLAYEDGFVRSKVP